MKLLLDTHIFLWYVTGDSQLPLHFRDTIRDPANQVFLSVVSLWETIVKHNLGKLPLPEPPEILLPTQRDRHQITNLSLDEASALQLARLPSFHRNPFDRMLICQALAHGLTLATLDSDIHAYPVSLLARD